MKYFLYREIFYVVVITECSLKVNLSLECLDVKILHVGLICNKREDSTMVNRSGKYKVSLLQEPFLFSFSNSKVEL